MNEAVSRTIDAGRALRHKRGDAFQRPTEATLNPRTLLFALSPFPAGAEGDEHETPRTRGHR